MAHPFRYTFILGLAALGTALAALGGWRFARASAPVNGPIVLISIDTLRPDHLAAYGSNKIRTPAIDELAAEGVVFERAYSNVPQTLPAHASLLTGRLPFDTGIRDNVGFALSPSKRLLAEMLDDRGYATAGIVSSFTLRKETGIGRGFALFDSEMQPAQPDMAVGELRRDGAVSERLAERWLDQANTSRAFLFLHLYEPHKPYLTLERYAQYSPYDAAIAYADEIVGRLIRYLKTHQLYDQTTIILLSDHGEGLGDHGEAEHGLLLHEEALHVPLIVKQAAGEGAGRRVRDVVQHVDLVPTILDLVKAPIPGNLPGRSLKPLLDGGSQFPGRLVYSESLYGSYHFGWPAAASVTDGRYRYIATGQPEMYDHRDDPTERQNLIRVAAPVLETSEAGAADGSQRAAAVLRAELERLGKNTAIPLPSEVKFEDRERFEALGYVGTVTDASSAAAAPETVPAVVEDSYKVVDAYRRAIDFAVTRRWSSALDGLQQLVRTRPDLIDAWRQIGSIAARAGRHEQAVGAYRHLTGINPADVDARLGTGDALLRLRRFEEARQEGTLAVEAARALSDRPPVTGALEASGHRLLARIAIARRDFPVARAEAALAHEADATDPMPSYVEGRISYESGQYADALGSFEAAVAELERSHGRQILDLHLYAGESLSRLDQISEAEIELREEIRYFPQNTRAWTELATLYHDAGRSEDAEQALSNLVRVNPMPDAYLAASRLWTSFGNRRYAAELRARAVAREQ